MEHPYYFAVNFLITLIWWVIPWLFNIFRWQYNLPLKMILWPMKESFFKTIKCGCNDATIIVVGIGIVPGLVLAAPAIAVYIITKFILWLIANVSFSKEEKAQIAVGSIEKKR